MNYKTDILSSNSIDQALLLIYKVFTRLVFLPHCDPSSSACPSESEGALSYAVLMLGIGCYGTGPTRTAAIEAARKWLTVAPEMDSIPDFDGRCGYRDLCIARCTARYAREIERRGGCAWVPYQVNEAGSLDTAESANA